MKRLCMLLAALMAGSAALAQVSTATLTGIVTDASAARIAGAAVQLSNQETGVSTRVSTNAEGEYTFALLIPGAYRLDVEAQGFRRHSRSGIVLEMGRTARLDMALELGAVAEVVEVKGTAPLLESESSTVGQFIENKTIIDMPLQGRRVGELLGLMGHSVFIAGDVIRPRVSTGGGRGDQQQWIIDGVNATNIALEVAQALFNPPVEAVQEIRVQQNSYSAEFGNSSSGVVTISTKSGTNDLHGNLYEFVRNDKLDARNFFSAGKAPLRWNVFGVAVSGPIRKNRTFFFTSNEWQRQRVGLTRLLTVPTPEQRTGDFSATLTAAGGLIRIYDPNSTRADPANPGRLIRDPFAGNVIPSSRIDPVAAKIVPLYPAPNQPPVNLAGASNFNRNTANALDLTTWTSKVDHVFSDRDRVSVRFILHNFPTRNGVVFEEPAADPNGNQADRRAYSLVVNPIHSFSPTVLNDFRLNWQPRRYYYRTRGLGDGWPGKLGLRGVSDRAFPQITAAGFTNLGGDTQERIQIPIHDTHLVETLSWFRRAHSFKFGGELRLAHNGDRMRRAVSGQIGFGVQPTAQPNVGNTGHAVASLLLGFPNSGQIRDSDLLDRTAKYFAGFVQDDWKVSSNLTLNVGLRWETHTPRIDKNNRQNGFDAQAINPVSGTPGVVTFAGRAGLGPKVYNGDYNNFAPRVGLAWRPFGRTGWVVRSGYGVFFGPPLPGTNNTSAGFEASGSFSTPDNGVTAPFYLRSGFPDTSRRELGPGFGAVRGGESVWLAPEFIEVNRRLGYTQQWNFGIQRNLGWETLLEASYLGTVGHKLNGPNTSINQVPAESMGPGNAQVRRPFPQFGDVTSQAPMWGNSSYHGLNLKVEKRFTHGLNFLANYTFSKFIDDVPAAQEIGQMPAIQNVYARRAEKSLAGNDVRNRFVLSGVWETPAGKGRRWLSQGAPSMILGGWNVGAVLLLQAGSPYGLTTQTNTTNAFTPGPQRVNVLRNPALSASQQRTDRAFDTTAVAAPAPYTFGNSARALVTGNGIINLDLSLLKNHRWGERKNVQLRLESFNLLNHPNFEEPGRALGSPAFGVISVARPARVMQLGMKLEF